MEVKVSILVPAYNEGENIGRLLKSLLHQKIYPPFTLTGITVVASGCTDNTEDVVKEFCKSYKKVNLITTKKRLGKASAVNLFLRSCKDDLIVMISADVLPADNLTINTLLQPFLDERVGIAGGRPIPINPNFNLTTRISSLIWHIHHRISSHNPPKLGEIVAFRNIVDRIPSDTLADEERLSAVIQRKGYRAVYVKDAVVYNKSPEKISELIEQRKRIFIGHLMIKKELGYEVPTLSFARLFKVAIDEISDNPSKLLTVTPLATLELFCRFLGLLSYLRKNYKPAWKVAKTTKKLH